MKRHTKSRRQPILLILRSHEGGPRLENMVACQLLKYCHWREDTEGHVMVLRYLRDTDKREVDFVVLCGREPEFTVECKTGERSASPAAAYFKARRRILALAIMSTRAPESRVLPYHRLCRKLELP